MREIKFRAWFKDTNEMKAVATNNLYMGNTSWMHLSPMPLSDYRLVGIMQFTGLKDKSDVEIYEGDIVELFDEEFKHVVEWNEQDESGYGIGWGLFPKTFVYKVIGNIYENPELI